MSRLDVRKPSRKKVDLVTFLLGLAEWLDGEGLDHNAARVRQAASRLKKLEAK